MGRHFEVRAKAMEASAKKKSAINMRASKEIYMAAKSGTPDLNSNLALRAVVEKHKSLGVPKEVIERAIKKAQGGETTDYIPGRYEFFGPGNSYIVVDSLTDNVNRAISEIRSAITKKGGHMGTVVFNFTEYGCLVFKTTRAVGEVEELLIMGDVDLQEISALEEQNIECYVNPNDLAKARDLIKEQLGVTEFELDQIMLVPNETMQISDSEDLEKFKQLMDVLDELEDVQAVYHNVEID